MFKRKIKVNPFLLAGILIYAGFIGILYLRMKYAEQLLNEYSDAQLCLQVSNCRMFVVVDVLDYGSSKMSFVNYGPKGIPMGTTTFEEYLFVVSGEGLGERTLKILPDISIDSEKFDVKNTYVPTTTDGKFVIKDLLNGKFVSVEVWHNVITFIFISPLNLDGVGSLSNETTSVGPLNKFESELALPTEDHPLIRAELAKRDFEGWSIGVIFMLVSASVFGLSVSGLFVGLSWSIKKIVKTWRKQ